MWINETHRKFRQQAIRLIKILDNFLVVFSSWGKHGAMQQPVRFCVRLATKVTVWVSIKRPLMFLLLGLVTTWDVSDEMPTLSRRKPFQDCHSTYTITMSGKLKSLNAQSSIYPAMPEQGSGVAICSWYEGNERTRGHEDESVLSCQWTILTAWDRRREWLQAHGLWKYHFGKLRQF